jgi:PAS domain S-box-containing protein
MNITRENPDKPARRTILIVDDNPANLEVVGDYLAKYGLQVMGARDGETALKLARQDHPDLILLDVRLPGIDGFEVCRRLKADERTREIAVIFMTVAAKTEDKVRGFEAGGVDYITKPFQQEEVLARVTTHLRLRDLTQRLEEAKESLERRVEERTAALAQANQELQAEIAERIRVEAALKRERALIANIMETSPVGITVVNREGQVTFANSQAEQVLGLVKDEITQRTYNAPAWRITDFAGGPFPDEKLPFQQVMATRQSVYDVQHAIEWPDGRRVFLAINGVPILDESRQVESVVFALQNITERKRAEAALRDSEERLRLTMEAANIGSWDWDVKNDIWYASPIYYTMLGYEPKAGPADRNEWLERVHPDDRDYVAGKIQDVLSRDFKEHRYEARLRHADGTYRWQYVRGFGIERDKKGNVTRMLGIRLDITERKQAENKLRRFNEELEQRVLDRTAQLEAANKELEAFAYSISHDLRSPLRHIDGYLELLKQRMAETLDERSRHYMATISDAATRMGQLIDDLLAFSRMGRNELSKTPVNLGALVQDIIRELAPETQGRAIHWRIAPLPTVSGDQAMLRLVLTNLLSNALKFTRGRAPADIEIGCQAGQEETIIFIRDNGVGFEMAYADKLFGVFQRLHRVEEFEGTGIGLANARRIITRHGGRVWAEGKVDQGATFYFSLPKTIQKPIITKEET